MPAVMRPAAIVALIASRLPAGATALAAAAAFRLEVRITTRNVDADDPVQTTLWLGHRAFPATVWLALSPSMLLDAAHVSREVLYAIAVRELAVHHDATGVEREDLAYQIADAILDGRGPLVHRATEQDRAAWSSLVRAGLDDERRSRAEA